MAYSSLPFLKYNKIFQVNILFSGGPRLAAAGEKCFQNGSHILDIYLKLIDKNIWGSIINRFKRYLNLN